MIKTHYKNLISRKKYDYKKKYEKIGLPNPIMHDMWLWKNLTGKNRLPKTSDYKKSDYNKNWLQK